MDEEIMEIQDNQEEQPEEIKKKYVPRPRWQIWLARAAVAFMIVSFLLYCYQIATGGR